MLSKKLIQVLDSISIIFNLMANMIKKNFVLLIEMEEYFDYCGWGKTFILKNNIKIKLSTLLYLCGNMEDTQL